MATVRMGVELKKNLLASCASDSDFNHASASSWEMRFRTMQKATMLRRQPVTRRPRHIQFPRSAHQVGHQVKPEPRAVGAEGLRFPPAVAGLSRYLQCTACLISDAVARSGQTAARS